ncbi:hypothetical protein FS837_008899 [Tulasnella sp. UAMH 9824]|nr:hypothetical protein FS837_008899 [Tulasnella sp. UAMH 9824]
MSGQNIDPNYFLTLHNLMQSGDIEMTTECIESMGSHPQSWACYIHITQINNLIYRNVGPYTFIGAGPGRREAKDDAARNALRGLGFNFANGQ